MRPWPQEQSSQNGWRFAPMKNPPRVTIIRFEDGSMMYMRSGKGSAKRSGVTPLNLPSIQFMENAANQLEILLTQMRSGAGSLPPMSVDASLKHIVRLIHAPLSCSQPTECMYALCRMWQECRRER